VTVRIADVSAVIHLSTDVALDVRDASVALDENWIPYVQASLQCAMVSEAVLSEIDPRDGVRITLTATVTGIDPVIAPVDRVFDLLLRERVIDSVSDVLTLSASSDEALLIDGGLVDVEPDVSAEVVSSSLREIIEQRLEGYDAYLWPLVGRNLCTNPSGEVDASGWTAFAGTGGTNAISSVASTPYSGSRSIRASWTVATSAVSGGLYWEGDIAAMGLAVGDTISLALARIRLNVQQRLRLRLEFRTASTSVSNVDVPSFVVPANTSYDVDTHPSDLKIEGATIPATTTIMRVTVYAVAGTSAVNWANGNLLQVDALMINRGPTAHGYFDGSTVLTGYTYTWDGTAHLSQSRRAVTAGAQPDADYTVTAEAFNFAANSRAVLNLIDWGNTVASGTATAARVATGGPRTDTPTFVRATATGAGAGAGYETWYDVRFVRPGDVIVLSLDVRAASQSNVEIGVVEYTNGSVVNVPAAVTVPCSGVWTRVEGPSWEVSPGVQVVRVYVKTLSNLGVGLTFDVTGIRFSPVVHVDNTDYFDLSKADTSYYGYDTQTLGIHRRYPLIDRAADLLVQYPGDTDWNFLSPLVDGAALRLFCDEERVWRLIDPATYTVAGSTAVEHGVNEISATDSISMQATRPDGSPAFFTGAVVKYNWTDSTGPQQEYDAAGTSTKVHRVEVSRPYPGDGAAAAIVARALGRGRTQTLEAPADLETTPGQSVTTIVDGVPDQEGIVSNVSWSFSSTGDAHDVMTVTPRDLEEA
jgi:hypothetical protein